MTLVRPLILAVLISLCCAAAAEARCRKPQVWWHFGDNQTSHWTVSSGGICVLRSRTRGTTALYAIEVTVKPKHGVVGHAERYAIAYRANPGYKGPDSFVLTFVGTHAGTPGSARVTVEMTVE